MERAITVAQTHSTACPSMASAPSSPTIDRLLSHQKPLRTWSLVITFFGDSIVPRGGEVWLGTLTEVMNGLGIDDQAVRAAVSRLTKDGWLGRRRVGRNSYYRLLEDGRQDFSIATDRIYGDGPVPFDGRVTVLSGIASGLRNPEYTSDAALLSKHGWGRMGQAVFCRFGDRKCPHSLEDRFVRIAGETSRDDAAGIVSANWDLPDIAAAYEEFLAAFQPFCAIPGVASYNDAATPADPLEALMLRTLLIHGFRRIVLRDPMLPGDLMPSDWPGETARGVTAILYRAWSESADRWLEDHGACSEGKLPPPDSAAMGRFLNV